MQSLDLQEIRGKLDQIDKTITELFEERMKLCADVAAFKIETGKAVYDGAREQEKLHTVGGLAHGEFNRQAVTELFSQIMTISRRYQYQLLAEHGKVPDSGFEPVEHLARDGVRVVYQGVEGPTAMKRQCGILEKTFRLTTSLPGRKPWKKSVRKRRITQSFPLKILPQEQ